MKTPLLKLEDLSLERDGKNILSGINLEVYPTEILAVLGHNGAGKSSLAYTIMGLPSHLNTSGRIIYEGCDITQKPLDERARIGMGLSWQEPARFEGLTVEDYLRISAKDQEPKDYLEALNIFGLNPEKYAQRTLDEKLSGGERKRIELAALFVSQPKLMLLDEPDSGIDADGIANMKERLRTIPQRGRSAIIITHQQSIAEIADRVAIICGGYIEIVGQTGQVLNYYNRKCGECPNKR